MERVYLDNAATTPLDKEVRTAMLPYFDEQYGNPSSLHRFGQDARAAIDHSRETIAGAIGAGFREVIFTGSATEANNLAVRGAVKRARVLFANLHGARPMKIVVSAIEHESILATADDLEREGIEVVRIPVDGRGLVDLGALRDALDERTVLVSVMHANNEVGTVQPIAEIAGIVRAFRSRAGAVPHYPLLHTDAVQAFQFLECDVRTLGADLMTLSAHKVYGPKGVGALYVRSLDSATHFADGKLHLVSPRIAGGGQEFGMRSGTENVPAIVGFAKAAELVIAAREREGDRLRGLRDRLWHGIKETCPQAEANGIGTDPLRTIVPLEAGVCGDTDPGFRRDGKECDLPNILNVYFPGHRGGELLIALDLQGIAVSSGSACAARSAHPSHVLQAMGFSEDRAGGSLRFSLGRFTTEADIERSIEAIRAVLVSGSC